MDAEAFFCLLGKYVRPDGKTPSTRNRQNNNSCMPTTAAKLGLQLLVGITLILYHRFTAGSCDIREEVVGIPGFQRNAPRKGVQQLRQALPMPT